jgi:signal transduction histidine kinase
LKTGPPPEASGLVKFLELAAASDGADRSDPADPSDRLSALLEFGRQHTNETSECGLPMAVLVFAEALKAPNRAAFQSRLKPFLQLLLNAPAAGLPDLLERVGGAAGSTADGQAMLDSCASLWRAQQRLRDLAEILGARCDFASRTPTNFWVEAGNNCWYCRALTPTNAAQGMVVRTYPRGWIDDCLRTALDGTPLPGYLAASIALDGEPGRPPEAMGPMFAEARGQIGEAGGVLVVGPEPEPSSAAEERPAYTVAPAGFTLRLHLANPDLLLRAHRQRVWRFGGLIVVSALAALAGLLAAWRSFQRQLRLSELKSNFVSSVSHELRAPIASVRLMAESLERGKISEPAKQQEYFRFISQECRRLSSLIENVLDFSRIDQGRKQYEFEPADLSALVHRTVQLMDPYAAERGVKLAILGSPASLPAVLDAKAMQQALINLLDNAIKHSPNGATVRIGLDPASAGSANSSIALWVEDDGEGIPPAEHERIFERFYRRGSELRRETQGVGIGLSIVKHIVTAHSGTVTVRSDVGRGSRFTIQLPGNHQAPSTQHSPLLLVLVLVLVLVLGSHGISITRTSSLHGLAVQWPDHTANLWNES